MAVNGNRWESNELAWLAERYVLGELAAAELETFEEAVASDLEVQTAVAAAVDRIAALAEVISTTATPGTRTLSPSVKPKPASRLFRLLPMAVVASAALVGLGVYWVTEIRGPVDSEVAWAADEEVLTEIAEEWSQVREETASFAGWNSWADRSWDELDWQTEGRSAELHEESMRDEAGSNSES